MIALVTILLYRPHQHISQRQAAVTHRPAVVNQVALFLRGAVQQAYLFHVMRAVFLPMLALSPFAQVRRLHRFHQIQMLTTLTLASVVVRILLNHQRFPNRTSFLTM